MSSRFGITTLSSFKKAIQDIPDDYFIGTNEVGNINIYRPDNNKIIKLVGFIELTNLDFVEFRDGIDDCEFTDYRE